MVTVPMGPAPSPRPVNPSLVKPTPSIIQAAPTVYTAPPVSVVQRKPDVHAQRQARMVFELLTASDQNFVKYYWKKNNNKKQSCCFRFLTSLCVLWILQEELAARVAKQQAAVKAAGLLDKKERDESSSAIGPNMPEPEPLHTETTVGVSVFSVQKRSLGGCELINGILMIGDDNDGWMDGWITVK